LSIQIFIEVVVRFWIERETAERERQKRDTNHLWLLRILAYSSEKGPRGSSN
jgi:ribosomal protein L20